MKDQLHFRSAIKNLNWISAETMKSKHNMNSKEICRITGNKKNVSNYLYQMRKIRKMNAI